MNNIARLPSLKIQMCLLWKKPSHPCQRNHNLIYPVNSRLPAYVMQPCPHHACKTKQRASSLFTPTWCKLHWLENLINQNHFPLRLAHWIMVGTRCVSQLLPRFASWQFYVWGEWHPVVHKRSTARQQRQHTHFGLSKQRDKMRRRRGLTCGRWGCRRPKGGWNSRSGTESWSDTSCLDSSPPLSAGPLGLYKDRRKRWRGKQSEDELRKKSWFVKSFSND